MKSWTSYLLPLLGLLGAGPASAQTFKDVPADHWAYSFIETLAASGVTTGCGGGKFCPEATVSRAQMAVFLERSIHGSDFVPPPAQGNVFLDVPVGAFAAGYIERLFDDGITSGCGNNNYCPTSNVSRAQMAVFLLRAKHGSAFTPPAARGVFADVDLGHWAVHWIEELAAEGITTGCGNGNYCPDALVTRAQMAVFLVRAFDLKGRRLPSSSVEITPAGGMLSVTNANGDLIVLEFPPGALDEAEIITMTVLETSPPTPFAMDLLPGIELEPHGLVLQEPATFTVKFADPQSNPNRSLVFWAAARDLALPLGNQTSTSGTISAEVYHFSTLTGGQPTDEQVQQEARKIAALKRLGLLPDPYGWLDTKDLYEALLTMSRLTGSLGNTELETQYREAALGILEEGSLRFLDIAVAAKPCEEYTPILHKFLDAASEHLGAEGAITQLLKTRLLDVDSVWCCFSLTGSWSSTEVADETDCDEGVNVYYAAVLLTDNDGAISMTWGSNGSATATKARCALTGWGGANEDAGYTYGDGRGSIQADGRTIDLSARWIWLGVDENTGEPDSCEGTSQITMRR